MAGPVYVESKRAVGRPFDLYLSFIRPLFVKYFLWIKTNRARQTRLTLFSYLVEMSGIEPPTL